MSASKSRRRKRDARRRRHRHQHQHHEHQMTTQGQSRGEQQQLTIADWLSMTDRKLDHIRGDGNCFFRALSKEVYGSEDFHAEFRQAICSLIDNNHRVFKKFVDGGRVSCHMGLMRQAGTWATTCELFAAASWLQRKIYVLVPTTAERNAYSWAKFRPFYLQDGGFCDGDVKPCYITLLLKNGNHYEHVTPSEKDVCNCQLDPPLRGSVLVVYDASLSYLPEKDGGEGGGGGGGMILEEEEEEDEEEEEEEEEDEEEEVSGRKKSAGFFGWM